VYKINRVNRQIRARQVLVIDQDGTKVGVMSPREGMTIAGEKGLDLVEVAPRARPPVCRVMDHGKFMYEQSKRAKKSKQTAIKLKEVKFKPDTAEHDYQFKLRHAERFLKLGNKVKATVEFRGREVVHSHLGKKMLDRLANDLAELGSVERPSNMESRYKMTMLLMPKEPEKGKVLTKEIDNAKDENP